VTRSAQDHELAASRASWPLICRIRPIRPSPLLPSPLIQPGGSELFRVAAVVNEIALQRCDLLVEQIVCLVNQA